ncbi:MAG: AAA family ATPase [Leptospiraceae bacterium]|nr:AAA family ATPase [Leptospiraceae bacterium]
MLKIAYGEASFENLRNRGDLYIDKTKFIPLMENHTKFFFIRPRRFGKSLWLSVLHAYYDTNQKDKFDKLFDELYVQKNPTNYKNSYLILRFDFSGLNTENEFNLKNDFNFRVKKSCEDFLYAYKDILKEQVIEKFEKYFDTFSTANLISFISTETKKVSKKVYVLIDEYDHYANKLASEGREFFVRNIVSQTGFVREFYEQMKIASGEGVFERFFITGVSPIMLDELASGFNILSDMTIDPRFNEMLGFTVDEVVGCLLDKVSDERYTYKTKEEVLQDLIHYYNGYRFSDETETKLFNSDMVLYFMEKFSAIGYPKELLDKNVKTDYGKLRGLIVGTSGKGNLQSIIEDLNLNQSLNFDLQNSFNFERRFGDTELKSLLFYLGLLTFSEPGEMKIPNYVIRTLYWEYLQKYLEEEMNIEFDLSLLGRAIKEMAKQGTANGLRELAVDFFQNKLSSYDYSGLTEKHVKFLFVSYFTLTKLYNLISERELPGRKRIDLLFEAHPAYYEYVFYNFIVEFKYIRKKDSEEEAKQKREEAINQAREYYEIYKRDFKQFGRELRSLALIVSHSREVELIEVCGFES